MLQLHEDFHFKIVVSSSYCSAFAKNSIKDVQHIP